MSEENANAGTPSPGELIRAELKLRGWTQDDLAKIIGKPTPRINELIQGKLAISPEMASALGAAFGSSAATWMQADTNYRLSLASLDTSDVERRAKLFSVAPIKDMEKRGWIQRTTTVNELEEELKRFFGVSDLSNSPSIFVSTRRTGGSEEENQELTQAQRAWCFRARAMAAEQILSPYEPKKFEECINALRPLAAFAPESRKVASVLGKYGIRFVIVEPLPGAKIDGAAFWMEDNPAIALSVRYDRIDAFWFTLCHELSHVRHRDPLSVDTALVGEDALPSAMKVAFEERADNEAGDTLVPQNKLDSFVHRVAPYYDKERIIQFAHVIKVHPGIIVGQLQHRGQLGYHANRDLLVKVRKHAISGAVVDGWGHATA
jgi:HTH-type transcriptional regulator / antitoxin HigA